jgi:hypothetical protein
VPILLARRWVTPFRFGGKTRGSLEPALQHLAPGRIREQRRQIILPQGQEAARKIGGVGHGTEYTPWLRAKQRTPSPGRVFDEAIAPKHCIVGMGDCPRDETMRA